ncbi:MAG: NTP transferase domain-containing protein, partial [Gemmatimonadetes bacterium]|nr:NTP transferase domain-containing protein [Gemmatimonadota bacterium]
MHNGTVNEAVILAAGEGSRMNAGGTCEHKALRRLLGIPLIERGILALREAGIERFVVILGHAAAAVRDRLGDGSRLGVEIVCVECRDWVKGNGASLYAAREALLQDRFLVAMADHWYEPGIPRRMIEAAAGDQANLLVTDSRVDAVFDADDATRVRVDASGTVRAVGKGLDEFNAVDCGLFVFSREVFGTLQGCFAAGDFSVTGAANRLSRRGQLASVDAGGLMWEDVDTEEAIRAARRKLVGSLPGRDDGPVARLINRRLSVPLSLAAVRLGATPNSVSAIGFGTAVLAGVAFALGHPLAGGVASQVASIVDGSDGEVARARFQASAWGGLLDSIL